MMRVRITSESQSGSKETTHTFQDVNVFLTAMFVDGNFDLYRRNVLTFDISLFEP